MNEYSNGMDAVNSVLDRLTLFFPWPLLPFIPPFIANLLILFPLPSHFLTLKVSTKLTYLDRVLDERVRAHAQQQAAASAAPAAGAASGAAAAGSTGNRPPPIIPSGLRVLKLLLGTGTPQALAGAGAQVREHKGGGGIGVTAREGVAR